LALELGCTLLIWRQSYTATSSQIHRTLIQKKKMYSIKKHRVPAPWLAPLQKGKGQPLKSNLSSIIHQPSRLEKMCAIIMTKPQ